MLLQFSVANYGSIKNKVVLDLVPSPDRSHPENIISSENYKANAIAAVYGANGSGKSTLHRAITGAIVYIRNSSVIQVGQPIPVIPYRFCEDPVKNPTEFEFTFIAEDGKKYVYGFSATIYEVVEEHLYCYHSAKASLVFERSRDTYTFSRNSKPILSPLTRMNTPNKLFLSTATIWNAEQTVVPFKWFAEKIDTQDGLESIPYQVLNDYTTRQEENVAFAVKLLKMADINISGIRVEAKEIPRQGLPIDGLVINNQVVRPLNTPQPNYQTEFYTSHSVTDENGNTKEYSLSLRDESHGSAQLVFFAPSLKRALDGGKVLVIDEIERGLHPSIVKLLINIFRDPEMNKNGAQLIITTHETPLLSLETFRRDEVYFTEKDNATGITDLYSLNDLSVRKDENIEKGYLAGRYGAIPFLQTEEFA